MAIRNIPTFGMPASFRILIADTADEVDGILVAEMAQRFVLARRVTLASGSTFARPYAKLRLLVSDGFLDLSHVEFRHLDEFMDTEPQSHGSLSREITEALFPAKMTRHGTFIPTDTRIPNVVSSHESAICDSDVVLLGIGANGHLAFNEPGTPLHATTNIGALTDSSRSVHRAAFARGGRDVPAFALTAGPATILTGRHLLLAAKGKAKAAAVAAMLSGPVSSDCPASAIRLHDHATIVLDAEAASTWLAKPQVKAEALPTEVLSANDLSPAAPVVVIAPHPDDAGISCGGLLASLPTTTRRVIVTWSTGERISRTGLSVAEGTALRESEAREEAARLGCEIRFMRSRAYGLGRIDLDDVADLRNLLSEIKPAWVFASAREDSHPTHRLCRVTTDLALTEYVASGSTVDCWTMEGPWHLLSRNEANALVRIDENASLTKSHAIRAHASQIERVPFDRAAEALERLRAVAFSESHLGGRVSGQFDPDTRLEVFRRVRLTFG